jgi:hypothetical protein
MTKNITLKIDDGLIKECKRIALEEDKSVSQWVSDLIVQNLIRKKSFDDARAKALKNLSKFDLGSAPISRDDLHDR